MLVKLLNCMMERRRFTYLMNFLLFSEQFSELNAFKCFLSLYIYVSGSNYQSATANWIFMGPSEPMLVRKIQTAVNFVSM
jgi:hypothetical protein